MPAIPASPGVGGCYLLDEESGVYTKLQLDTDGDPIMPEEIDVISPTPEEDNADDADLPLDFNEAPL